MVKNNRTAFDIKYLNLWHQGRHALKDINIKIRANEITGIIGPTGSGKSLLLKSMNRMISLMPDIDISGHITYFGENIYDKGVSVESIRTTIGMVFKKPNLFQKSIFENVAYGPRIHGVRDRNELMDIVEESLDAVGLWRELKGVLNRDPSFLSLGRQQCLCIARALAVKPAVLLMDDPTRDLDPVSTLKIEDCIQKLKKDMTIVIATGNVQQAARISDTTAFFLNGEIIEWNDTDALYTKPKDQRTEDFITGVWLWS